MLITNGSRRLQDLTNLKYKENSTHEMLKKFLKIKLTAVSDAIKRTGLSSVLM